MERKLEVMSLNKKFLNTFGMCLDAGRASNRERLMSQCVNWTMLWISILTIAISIEYIVSLFNDTESILFAVMQVVANTASGGGYWTFYNKKYQVSRLLTSIENLVKSRKSHTSFFARNISL